MLQISLPVGDQIKNIFAYNTEPNSLGNLIGNIVGLLLSVSLIISLFFVIIGGINWITAEGKPDKLEQARNTIIGSLIGLVLAMAAWAIWQLVNRFFGLNLAQ